MATLNFKTDDFAAFNPISAALAALPNGAGTIAVLVRRTGDNMGDMAGLLDNDPPSATNWYHTIGASYNGSIQVISDDDGTSMIRGLTNPTDGLTADAFIIAAVTWPAGATQTERIHFSGPIGSAEAWTHENSATTTSTRSGPSTSAGHFCVGYLGDSQGPAGGNDIALVAVWAGHAMSDAEILDLWVNKKTSDWYNHAAGHPTLLIECTSLTPTDIGANPSTFSTLGGTASPTLTGLVPTGWTFDGIGSSTTPVTQTLTATYLVKKILTKAATQATYVVKVPILKAATAASYKIRVQVAKTLSPSYKVVVRVAKAFTATYTISASPVILVLPVISGQPLTGQTLTVDHGSWTNSPTSYAVQWQVETGVGTGVYEDIVGETADTLNL